MTPGPCGAANSLPGPRGAAAGFLGPWDPAGLRQAGSVSSPGVPAATRSFHLGFGVLSTGFLFPVASTPLSFPLREFQASPLAQRHSEDRLVSLRSATHRLTAWMTCPTTGLGMEISSRYHALFTKSLLSPLPGTEAGQVLPTLGRDGLVHPGFCLRLGLGGSGRPSGASPQLWSETFLPPAFSCRPSDKCRRPACVMGVPILT